MCQFVRSDYVFVNVNDKETHRDYYLDRFHYRNAFMRKMCNKLGITPFGYHAIRHFTASHLYSKGHPISVIQAILRHTNPNTTAGYLRTLGLDPAIREALEEGVSRPAEIISLEERRLVNGLQD